MASLPHGPAKIIAQLFRDKGWASDPDGDPIGPWPVYDGSEPDAPADVLVISETEPQYGGRSMIDGENWLHRGFQVKLRADDDVVGQAKIEDLVDKMAREVNHVQITIDSNTYMVCSISRKGGPFDIGTGSPNDKRSVFTMNAIAAIERLA